MLYYIDLYTNYMRNFRGFSEKTIKMYSNYCYQFNTYSGVDPLELHVGHYYAFMTQKMQQERGIHSRYSHEGEGKMSSQSLQCVQNGVKGFLGRLYQHGLLTFDPKGLKSFRVERLKTEGMQSYEIDLFLRAPGECNERDDVRMRDTLLFQVGVYMGLRITEALSITFDQLTTPFVIILGKGRKKRKVPVPPFVQILAREFEELRKKAEPIKTKEIRFKKEVVITQQPKDRNPNIVFTSLSFASYGAPLRDDGIRKIMRKYEEVTGIGRRVNYHLFRHAFFTFLLESGVDLFTVQQMGGHSSIKSTQQYITVSDESKKIAQEKIGLRILRENFSKTQ